MCGSGRAPPILGATARMCSFLGGWLQIDHKELNARQTGANSHGGGAWRVAATISCSATGKGAFSANNKHHFGMFASLGILGIPLLGTLVSASHCARAAWFSAPPRPRGLRSRESPCSHPHARDSPGLGSALSSPGWDCLAQLKASLLAPPFVLSGNPPLWNGRASFVSCIWGRAACPWGVAGRSCPPREYRRAAGAASSCCCALETC